MCGSVALLKNHSELESTVRSALKLLESRGPDGSGISLIGSGAIAHCRLSLRDHEGGAQPLKLADGRTLSYVGELYNDSQLRSVLQLSGWSPENNGDTEVLASALSEWGDEAWSRFNAMFAVMLLSADGNSVKLVRDKFGIKPIFYARTQDVVAAASQPVALLECGLSHTGDQHALVHFLRSSQVSLGGQTILSEIKLVPPGTITTISCESANQVRWDNEKWLQKSDSSRIVPTSHLTYLLSEAVYRQSQADFPVGVFLSGGLDSSLIAALLTNVRQKRTQTFAAALVGDTDDLDYARIVAEHIDSEHFESVVSPEEFFAAMRTLTAERGLPVSLPNEVLIYKLALLAKNHVKAVLSGEGADELFGGYQRLQARFAKNSSDTGSFPLAYRTATSWFSKDDLLRGLLNADIVTEAEQLDHNNLSKLIEDVPADSAVRALLLKDHFAHLLLRLDGAAMAGSVEGRVPFTDSDVVDFALALCKEQLAPAFGLEKPALRKAAHGLLPEAVLRRPKRAFNASLKILFESPAGQQELNFALEQPLIAKLFKPEKLEQILTDDRENQVFHRTWLICSLGQWSGLCRVSEIC